MESSSILTPEKKIRPILSILTDQVWSRIYNVGFGEISLAGHVFPRVGGGGGGERVRLHVG